MNNYRRLWTILVISGLLASSCAGVPKATTSEYLETTGAEFEHGRERDTAHYVLEFSVKQAITQPIRINMKFENPEDSAVPFELMTQLRPGQDLLSIGLRPFRASRADENIPLRCEAMSRVTAILY